MAPPLVESRKSNVLDEYNGNLSVALVDAFYLCSVPLDSLRKDISFIFILFSLSISLYFFSTHL